MVRKTIARLGLFCKLCCILTKVNVVFLTGSYYLACLCGGLG